MCALSLARLSKWESWTAQEIFRKSSDINTLALHVITKAPRIAAPRIAEAEFRKAQPSHLILKKVNGFISAALRPKGRQQMRAKSTYSYSYSLTSQDDYLSPASFRILPTLGLSAFTNLQASCPWLRRPSIRKSIRAPVVSFILYHHHTFAPISKRKIRRDHPFSAYRILI